MATLQEIADMIGVSRTTVSNVIHGKTKRVSSETVTRIREKLKEVGYVPNMGSLLLNNSSSKIIGMVLGYEENHGHHALQDPFISEFLGVLATEVKRHGYYLMLIGGQEKNNIVDIASRWSIDGLVIIGFHEKDFLALRRKLNKPWVCVDNYSAKSSGFINVGIDDYSGGYQAGKYLLEMGHKDAIVMAENGEFGDHYRWLGFKKAYKDAGIIIGEERRFILSGYENIRMKQYKFMISRMIEAGAIFLEADYLAVEAINFLKDQGVSVPEQVSIIGFDDNMYARIVRPQLTTIHQNISEKATLAFHQLLKIIDNEPIENKKIKIPVKLVVRDSVTRKI